MGEVYLAEQDAPRRKVALKLLAPELSQDPGFRERFARESEAAASIDHPNGIPIYQSGRADGALFIAMRYVEGTDLRTLLAEQGPLPPERGVRICAQIADALEAAHERGLVHRDVKPANILIGRNDHAYLSDFGLIRRSEVSTAITKTGQFMGTIDYVAPEQIKGEAVDGRADVYSLGCVLYECLTREPPFRRETEVATLYAHLEDPPPAPSATVTTVPKSLDEVVAKAMAKAPDDRYASAAELATAVRESRGAPPGQVPQGRPSVSRRRAWLAAGAFLLLAAGIVVLWAPGRKSPDPQTAGLPAAVARIDNNSGSVTTRAHDRHWGWHLAAAEGAVWQTGPEGLIKRDESTGEVEKIFELDGQTHTVAAGFGSIWVAVVPAANRATLVQIAPATDEVVRSVEVDPSSGGTTGIVWVAVGRDAVWVFNGNGDLWKIDPISHNILLAKHDVATEGGGIAIGDGAVWVSDILGDEVVQLDESDGRELATIPMTAEPDWL